MAKYSWGIYSGNVYQVGVAKYKYNDKKYGVDKYLYQATFWTKGAVYVEARSRFVQISGSFKDLIIASSMKSAVAMARQGVEAEAKRKIREL